MNKLHNNKIKKSKNTNLKIYLHYSEPVIKLEGFEFIDVSKLDKIKNNSVEEILIQDLLDYHSDNMNISLIKKIVDKLKEGGKLHIQGIDTKAICYAVTYAQVDPSLFKILVFSNNKSNIYTISQIKKIINDSAPSMSIDKIKFLNGLQYYIECVKK